MQPINKRSQLATSSVQRRLQNISQNIDQNYSQFNQPSKGQSVSPSRALNQNINIAAFKRPQSSFNNSKIIQDIQQFSPYLANNTQNQLGMGQKNKKGGKTNSIHPVGGLQNSGESSSKLSPTNNTSALNQNANISSQSQASNMRIIKKNGIAKILNIQNGVGVNSFGVGGMMNYLTQNNNNSSNNMSMKQ